MKATGIPRLVLLYPYIAASDDVAFSEFRHVFDEERELVGVRVDPRLVGNGGLREFAKELAKFIKPLLLSSA